MQSSLTQDFNKATEKYQADLVNKIVDQTAKIVVVGLGYVGIPLAMKLAEAGYTVTGLDINRDRVEKLAQGIYPIEGDEPGMSELVANIHQTGRFTATTNTVGLAGADIYFIIVDTPLDATKRQPTFIGLNGATKAVAAHLKAGSYVVVESTIPPGTMDKIVRPILEQGGLTAGRDFGLAHVPERVMVGKLIKNLTTYNRVIGAIDESWGIVIKTLYQRFVQGQGKLEVVSNMVTAELVKTGENAYRDLQIAFANALALLCAEFGAEFLEVRHEINLVEDRNVHMAGAGVGGHCITKDSILMVANSTQTDVQNFIYKIREMNDYMPEHMVDLLVEGFELVGKELGAARVAVLGYAFMANTDDTRDAPTKITIKILEAEGVRPYIHDPYVTEYNQPLEDVVRGCDAVIVMTAHNLYKELSLAQLKEWMGVDRPVLIDGRFVYDKNEARGLGFTYLGVGNTV